MDIWGQARSGDRRIYKRRGRERERDIYTYTEFWDIEGFQGWELLVKGTENARWPAWKPGYIAIQCQG